MIVLALQSTGSLNRTYNASNIVRRYNSMEVYWQYVYNSLPIMSSYNPAVDDRYVQCRARNYKIWPQDRATRTTAMRRTDLEDQPDHMTRRPDVTFLIITAEIIITRSRTRRTRTSSYCFY